MISQTDSVLAAQPVSSGFVPQVPSVVRKCDHCGCDVWVSQQSLADVAARAPDFKIACIPCAREILGKDFEVLPPGGGARREIEQAVGRELTDAVFDAAVRALMDGKQT